LGRGAGAGGKWADGGRKCLCFPVLQRVVDMSQKGDFRTAPQHEKWKGRDRESVGPVEPDLWPW
jgi:hypothetical protein